MNAVRYFGPVSPVPALALLAVALVIAPSAAWGGVKVGDKAPISFTAVDGTSVSVEKLRGKIVVVDFWATWCGPCMAMADEMVAINKEFQPKGFQMIGVSLDKDKAALVKVVKEKNFAWPHYFNGKGWDNPIWKQYGERGIPFTLLIGPDGTVLWKGHPGAGLKQQIEKAMKEHPPRAPQARNEGPAAAAGAKVSS